MKLTALALAGILALASAKYDNTTVRHCTGECQSGKGTFSVWSACLLFVSCFPPTPPLKHEAKSPLPCLTAAV